MPPLRMRPEAAVSAEVFYDGEEAAKYTRNPHVIEVQHQIASRALELLNLPPDFGHGLILDIGCGSGLSGDILSEHQHFWMGVDVSRPMLEVALQRGIMGEVFMWDMGQGLTFRPGTFDGAISVSALQWLCSVASPAADPRERLSRLFSTLYTSLAVGARAVFQAYPENAAQMDMMAMAAARAGFRGGWVIDFPNSTRARKHYLVLMAGSQPLPVLHGDGGAIADRRRRHHRGDKEKPAKHSKAWVLMKRARRERKGQEVRPVSKYSGRRRKVKWS